EAVRLDPDADDYRARLGELLLKRSRAADALGAFEELHRRRPDNVDAAVGLARCRFALGDFDAAGRLLDEALARDPNHAAALAVRGQLALQQGHADVVRVA